MNKSNDGFRSFREAFLSKQFLVRFEQGFANEEARSPIIPIGISSCLWTLFGSSDLMILIILSLQNFKVDSF